MKQDFDKCDLRKIKVVGRVFFVFMVISLLLWASSLFRVEKHINSVASFEELMSTMVFAGGRDFQETFADSQLMYDTLIAVNDSAAPGDTFLVTINLTNTIGVGGAQITFNYDTSIIYPVYDIDNPCAPDSFCTTYTIQGYKTSRTQSLPFYVWSGYVLNNHIDTLRFSFLVNPEGTPKLCIPGGGTGPVVQFKFRVKPHAQPGDMDTLHFVFWDFQAGNYANNLNDTIGLRQFIPRVKKGWFTVTGLGPHPNHCPVFASMPDSFQVNEGQTLQFNVTATDQDTDGIELSLVSFTPTPPGSNYHFQTKNGVSTVTQTFDYTPDFTEAPVVRVATFQAKDQHDCITTKTVPIRVIETPQDMLSAGSQEGGVPGSTGKLVPFILSNSVDIYGFQFTFRWDQTKLDVDSIVPTNAVNGFSMYTNLGDSAGKATILIFGLASQTIPAGMDTVVYAAFSVHSDASSVEVPITLENAREAINPGYPSKSLMTVSGKFTIDLFGDVNLDRLVDVADVVSLVSYILGGITFTSRQWSAADLNKDLAINVGDLVAMIDVILGRWMGPSPPIYTGPMAKVSLDCQGLQPGSSGEVKVMANLKVPVAGAQLQIDYDPAEVSFQSPRLSERSDHFIAEYRDDGRGRLIVVLYNLANDPIQTGEGNILSLPALVSPNALEGIKIELKEVVLSDEKAVLIPTEGGSPSVPTAFDLDQNYPNPFNPTTSIQFTVVSQQFPVPTTLKIYNVRGQLVRTLVDEPKMAGKYEVMWDGRDDQGNPVASGIYFYKLRAGDFQDTKKMVLMK